MSPCHARRAAERFELRLEGARGSLAQARRRLEPLWLIELDHRRAVVVLAPRARGIGVAPRLSFRFLNRFSLLADRGRFFVSTFFGVFRRYTTSSSSSDEAINDGLRRRPGFGGGFVFFFGALLMMSPSEMSESRSETGSGSFRCAAARLLIC